MAYDAIIIGSGFGGAVLACRLAEQKRKVLVLERGRRWGPGTNPREPGSRWLWSERFPSKHNGWLDLRLFKGMAVAQGAAVGGGSHIYANISVEAKPEVFEKGWPGEITYAELKPYYDTVGKMLRVQTLPEKQATHRFNLMREGAQKLGYGDRFRSLPLAVNFDPDFDPNAPGARDPKNSLKYKNEQGVEVGTCVHCGDCDLGCPTKAKNTLDLNYLARAQSLGAEVRPLHLVKGITPVGNGYRVDFDHLSETGRIPGSETAPKVFLSAGSLGSTEMLLRCRDELKTLPALSPRLGVNWSSNGDFLTPAFYKDRPVSPSHGPTITCAIDFLDGKEDKQRFFIEDGGIPDLLAGYLDRVSKQNAFQRIMSFFFGHHRFAQRAFRQWIAADDPVESMMPWFAQGIDAGDGVLYLGRDWLMPWRKKLKLRWDITKSKDLIDAIVNMHKRLSAATGGRPVVPATWKYLKDLVTPHPLGGCNMGTSAENGVVDHLGRVFGYPGLYVADGAIVPEAVGLNPSRTIAALAERIAAHVVD